MEYVEFQCCIAKPHIRLYIGQFGDLVSSYSYVYSKQPIFGLTQEWVRELSFSTLT